MSLCFKVKSAWREFTTVLCRRKSSSCSSTVNEAMHLGAELGTNVQKRLLMKVDDAKLNSPSSSFEAHGVQFSTRKEMDEFISKMEAMREIFEKEISEISLQHKRLRAGGYLLNSRVLEMERIIKTDRRKGSIGGLKAPSFNDTSYYTSQDLQLLQEMDRVYDMLDNSQEEISSLRRHLDIEFKERTLYPEPTMLRSTAVEDEFSKKMKQDGGLHYQSKDKTMQRITYQCLPPPFSLQQIKTQVK
ncbi:uncharacterized protein LOC116301246 [Actinia tenebrosa]|uniref:Uncharacterized protein LOC116301246 n=1 Tax=Actinia tenebrosa TaxID=6105 RepID=A0A6P8IHJ3_ACTTE|nr:uncharacterized protein LOC116301246 [Actinia tenebrosa]